jgi:hypothetical protein
MGFSSEHLLGAHERHALPEGEPSWARGAGDLGPAKAESPALFFSPMNLLPSTVLCRQGRLEGCAPVATARFVSQSLYALFEKPLRPFVDKAAADPDRGGYVADRYPISQE